MEFLAGISENGWPLALLFSISLLLGWTATWLAKRSQQGTDNLWYKLFLWLLVSAAIIIAIILLPLSDETQGQILSLMGVVLTAIIALSSTTFVANAIAGIMLHATKPFRPGDYLRVNDQFGRVTRRSLVNTQIQTEWRDFTTLPNLLLLNNPITVMHRDGTIMSAEISIGYDIPYTRVEELLLAAATDAGLGEPYVLVHELLDHAVVYRICGFLSGMKNLLSARSNLRKRVLEQMHGNDVEIVSPSFVNQRRQDPAIKVIPEQPVLSDSAQSTAHNQAPEDKIFDKAEEAASLEELKIQQEEVRQTLKRERAHLKVAQDADKARISKLLETLENKEQWYSEQIEGASKGEKNGN